MKTKILFTLLFFACRIHYLYGQTNLQIAPETLATPEKNGIWLQPAQNTKAQPIWGCANGIRIGIAPLGGPRGLIRIYTPYLEHDEFVVTNFIAFEPIDKAKNNRGLSELEWRESPFVPKQRRLSVLSSNGQYFVGVPKRQSDLLSHQKAAPPPAPARLPWLCSFHNRQECHPAQTNRSP